jgi:phosphoserine phosphatase
MMGEHPKFGAICFDCDSTLARIEGIDELARRSDGGTSPADRCGDRDTARKRYAWRLEIVRSRLDALAGRRALCRGDVAGAPETIAALQGIGKPVYLVSGGFVQSVASLARAVGIPFSHVRAVEIHLDATGRYAGFDASSPLVRSDGKAEVCRVLAEHHGAVAIVGDGVTDLAARTSGAFVVGFGGVVDRQVMAEGADCFIADGPLTRTLEVLLSPSERMRLICGAKRLGEQAPRGLTLRDAHHFRISQHRLAEESEGSPPAPKSNRPGNSQAKGPQANDALESGWIAFHSGPPKRIRRARPFDR